MTIPRTEEQTFFIPGPLPGLNEMIGASNASRHKYNALKKKWEKVVWAAVKEYGIEPIDRAYFEFTWWERNRRRDPDNIAAARKFIFDGLVSAKILKGDGWKQIEGWLDEFCICDDEPGVTVYCRRVNK